ncbi:CDP-glucose 4,6-dehydratase [Geomonas sp. RF6]|uniref:CDP-glucose 4,6-dehydratase n=1 Tax=Geomonas sp. RF6 TaxID=2897342 RepID=UPI001E2FE026|nr:CDP-glucose 4,6-dehydratase [Geomonas sp. RF6]UFS71313.1 CDP-glucose 4,6-dehydratase [Geomonas sp. RF6]
MTEFFRGKKVFLTGHTGFKGSWLSLWLHALGAQVTGYALPPPTTPSLYRLCRIDEMVHGIEGDVRDAEGLARAIEDATPEIVIHMAAQPLVRRSYRAPLETYQTNVMGTVHLLEGVRRTPSVRAVLNVTTDKCYENREWPWGYRENEPMGGYDPYSSSKGCSELVTAAYRSSFFNPSGCGGVPQHRAAVASARAGNVIGGGDWAEDRLISDCIAALMKDEPVQIRNPHAIRPWQHVLEPLSGYLLLARSLYEEGERFSGAWNFGPRDDDARPVEWIVSRLCGLWSGKASYELSGDDHPHEASYLKLDCSKARAELGWRPVWSLETALEKIVEWANAFRDGADLRTVSLDQIRQYAARCGSQWLLPSWAPDVAAVLPEGTGKDGAVPDVAWMKMQLENGFVSTVLASASEDVWNEL